jgi:hypothetical protein
VCAIYHKHKVRRTPQNDRWNHGTINEADKEFENLGRRPMISLSLKLGLSQLSANGGIGEEITELKLPYDAWCGCALNLTGEIFMPNHSV